MTTSKVIKIAAAVGVVALLSYGGLAWWQLSQFDRRVGEHRYFSSLFYDGEIQVEKAFLRRKVQLTAGINTDGQEPGQRSVTDPVIVFDGVLTPGLRPTLKLTPIRVEDPQAEIFFKSRCSGAKQLLEMKCSATERFEPTSKSTLAEKQLKNSPSRVTYLSPRQNSKTSAFSSEIKN